MTVLADRTEVDSLATFREEEKTIEAAEQEGRRLMDRAQNGLSSLLGQLLHQIRDGPGSLRVETTGWLIEEEQ